MTEQAIITSMIDTEVRRQLTEAGYELRLGNAHTSVCEPDVNGGFNLGAMYKYVISW